MEAVIRVSREPRILIHDSLICISLCQSSGGHLFDVKYIESI
jgi:hypothetical protein